MKRIFPALLLLANLRIAHAFGQPMNDAIRSQTSPLHTPQTPASALNSVSLSSLASTSAAALNSGPYGVLALTGIASSVVVPLTMYRQGYSFSVGYGFGVFAMALALWKQFQIGLSLSPLSLLASAVMFYGIRLGTFLLVREWTVPSKAEVIKGFDKSPRLKRIPLAVSVSMFYAFMTSPLMYAARAAIDNSNVMKAGVALAWVGAVMEAVADTQKFFVKRAAKDEDTFVGPTGGFYKICRHPNYLGELIFWFGLALAGVPSFGKSIIAWGCAATGFYGIFGIMTGATKRLDKKQEEKYSGQEAYDTYRKEVGASIFPWAQ